MTACGGNGTDVVVDSGVDGGSAKISCANGYSEYKIDGTPMQICYSQVWGEPKIDSRDGANGTAFFLVFKEAKNGPTIWYQTNDYVSTVGAPKVCYDCFNLYGNAEMVADSVNEALGLGNTDFKARKTDVGSKRAIRVHAKYSNDFEGSVDTVSIYVPDAFDGYDMMISGSSKVAEEIDELAFDMKFAE